MSESAIEVSLPGDRLYEDVCSIKTFDIDDLLGLHAIRETESRLSCIH